jgi:transcription antitermination factor NusG
MEKNWYALHARPEQLKRVINSLNKRKIELFCATQKGKDASQFITGNRKKPAEEKLFDGLVFVHVTDAEVEIIKRNIFEAQFMHWLGKPAIINDREIENLLHFTNVYRKIRVENVPVNPNQVSAIIKETFLHHSKVNLDGSLMPIQGVRARCTLPGLGKVLVADTEKAFFESFDVFRRKEALT